MRQTRRAGRSTQRKAEITVSRSAKPVHSVVKQIAENLAEIDAIRIVKVTPEFLQASSETSGARKRPITKPGHPTAIGVSIILDEDRKEIQFYEMTSAVKGYGSRMVKAVLNALPKNWKAFVLMDWSDGFWTVMQQRHRRIVLL